MSLLDQIVSVVDKGLGNSSYLVDLGDGRALVLDPSRDPSQYLALAEQRNLTVGFSVETHLHADFVSGSRDLAARGATVVAPAASDLEFPNRPLRHGDQLDLGGLTLQALATPGHTPEHLAYLLVDGANPLALFSGGSLIVGGAARTDLIAPEQTEDLARAQYRSITEQLLGLPDDLPVYPTHGAGSFCSVPTGQERTTTIGSEKEANPLLAVGSEEAFVRQLLDGYGSYPPYFLRLREVNRRGPTVYGPEPPELAQLDVTLFHQLMAEGAWVVDARPIKAFAAGHVPGSVSIGLRPAFASWLGWVIPDDVPLLFVLADGQDRSDLGRQARKVGYEHLVGELAGGLGAWEAAGLQTARLPLVEPGDIQGAVLDVRQAFERAERHIPGSVHVELGAVTEANGLPAGPLPAGPLTVACEHGERAMTGASLLARTGRDGLSVLAGGPADWAGTAPVALARASRR